MQVNAILFDAIYSKRYIFANNKIEGQCRSLPFIVDRLFEDVLCKEIHRETGGRADATSWLTHKG